MKLSSASSIIFVAALLGLVQAKNAKEFQKRRRRRNLLKKNDANQMTRDKSNSMSKNDNTPLDVNEFMPIQKVSRQDSMYMMDEGENMGMDTTFGQYGGEVPIYATDEGHIGMGETQIGQGRYFTQEDIDLMVQQGEVDVEGKLYSNDLDMDVGMGMDGTEETQFGSGLSLTQEDIDLMVEMDEQYEGHEHGERGVRK